MTTINLVPTTTYRAEHYGVILESNTRHAVTGKGVHNPSHNHTIEVWENRNGKDPYGNPTTAEYTFMTTAKPTVISTTPESFTKGTILHIGDTVTLQVNGFRIGNFRLDAGSLTDPVLVQL